MIYVIHGNKITFIVIVIVIAYRYALNFALICSVSINLISLIVFAHHEVALTRLWRTSVIGAFKRLLSYKTCLDTKPVLYQDRFCSLPKVQECVASGILLRAHCPLAMQS